MFDKWGSDWISGPDSGFSIHTRSALCCHQGWGKGVQRRVFLSIGAIHCLATSRVFEPKRMICASDKGEHATQVDIRPRREHSLHSCTRTDEGTHQSLLSTGRVRVADRPQRHRALSADVPAHSILLVNRSLLFRSLWRALTKTRTNLFCPPGRI